MREKGVGHRDRASVSGVSCRYDFGFVRGIALSFREQSIYGRDRRKCWRSTRRRQDVDAQTRVFSLYQNVLGLLGEGQADA